MNLLAAAFLLVAQEDLTVLQAGDRPKKMLEEYLLAECAKAFDARRKDVAALKTPEDVLRRATALRAKFVDALGGFPEKTPLNARVVGTLQRDGYRIERVVYESRPAHHVTANLYLPEGKGPFPGVLMPMGHSENGKAAEYAQRGCILLARNGLAALCYDPIGQGERKQFLDESGRAPMKSTTEHTQVGTGALLVGWSAATFRIWDGIRSIDYLASRPEIDPKRLGCTGVSGGGTLTSYLMALDDRILCAAPSCYVTSLERLFATIGPQDAEQNIPGQVAFGMEHADYVTMRAPKPTLILTGTRDFFDIQGSWITFREAKRAYGILGRPEAVDLAEFDIPHGYPKSHREGAVRWMRRWLLGIDDAIVEGSWGIEKDADLQCTDTGQVLSSLKGKSAFDLIADRAKELEATRPTLSAKELREKIRGMGIVAHRIYQNTEFHQTRIQRDGYTISRAFGESDGGMKLPYLVLSSSKPSGELVVVAPGEGKTAACAKGGPVERLVQAGHSVTVADLRGLGETAGSDFKESFLSLHLNRPLLAQRLQDVAQFVHQGKRVRVVGTGTAAPAVLHAAALEEKEPMIVDVTLEGMVVSWASVARTPTSKGQLSNVVPGALKAYDLPDVAAAIAPRPLTIRNPVDAAGKPVSQAELEQIYAPARAAYKAAGAEKNLILEAKP